MGITPTFKQRKFVHEYLKSGNKTQSALKAYNVKKPETAAQIAQKTFKSTAVQRYMREVLEAQGLTDEKIATKLQKIIDSGTTEEALKTTTPANALKAIEFAAKLKDVIPADRVEKKTARLNIDLKGKSTKELESVLNELITETKQFQRLVRDSNT